MKLPPATAALLLLFCALFPAVARLPAAEQALPVLALERPELAAGADVSAAALSGALLAAWRELYGDTAALIPARFAPAESPRVRIAVERYGAALGARVRCAAPGGAEESLTLRLSTGGEASLPSALAGGVFRLWARLTGYAYEPPARPPLPAGLLDLGALSLLPGAAELGDPLDLAAAPGGPLLVFGRGILRLGPLLEITPDTLRDLYLAPDLPAGTTIAAAFLGANGEPRLVFPAGGTLLYADPGGAERFDTGVVYPEDTAALPGGGFAMLKGRTLTFFRRAGDRLHARQVELPPGLYSALAADSEKRLWVFDLAERRFRIFSPRGREILSVTPLLAPGELQFPQTCVPLADGAVLLGGGGRLFCFEADGRPRWRMESLPSRVREALPAFFRAAPTPEEDGFYLLDAPRGRLLLFRDPGSLEAGRPEAAWAAAFPDFDLRDPGQLQAARSFLLDRRLLLQAYTPAALLAEPHGLESLARLAAIRSAGLSASLAENLEAQLLLPEAETALKGGLDLYHRLRRDDPVDPRWPAAIAELTARRAALRETLFSEPLLKIEVRKVRLVAGPAPGSGPRLLAEIGIRNNAALPLRTLRLEARLCGLSDAAAPMAAERLDGGRTLVRTLVLPLSAGLGAETRLCRLALRASYAPERAAAQSQYFAFALPLPPGPAGKRLSAP